MGKMKNIMIYIIVCIIIVASFKIPEMLFEIENNNIEIEVYKKEKTKSKLDVEAEKIYLVKAIHDIESDNTAIEISSSEKSFSLVESSFDKDKNNNKKYNVAQEQLIKLKEYNILKDFSIDEDTKYDVTLIPKTYQSKDKYIINNVFLNTPERLYNINIEEKTGKILFINFDKEELFDKITKEEILINYIKYLDLYIIDDWYYENDMLKSDKAGLVVNLLENSTRYIISIHSEEKKSNNTIYVYSN